MRMDKKALERLIFDRFLKARPLFAGVPIAGVIPVSERTNVHAKVRTPCPISCVGRRPPFQFLAGAARLVWVSRR